MSKAKIASKKKTAKKKTAPKRKAPTAKGRKAVRAKKATVGKAVEVPKTVEVVAAKSEATKQAESAVVTPDEKAALLGKPVKATALEMFNMRDTVVVLDSKDLPAQGSGFDRIAGHKFPSTTIMVTRFNKYNAKYVTMLYWTPGSKYETSVFVPNDFPLTVAPVGEPELEMIASYNVHLFKGLTHQLAGAFTSGADPEMFIENGKGELLPAFKFLGPKTKPAKYGSNDVYWDGFQAEFTVQAGGCAAYVIDSIHNGMKGLLAEARKHDKNAKLSAKTVFDIPVEMLRESAPEHVAFGCMPSLNAYDMEGIKEDGANVLYRASGGHVHFGVGGWTKDHIKAAIKSLDAILGVAGVSLFAKFDDPRRRQMYGLAGEYRTPKHGFEYRALSNAWLFHPLMANIVYDIARPAAMVGRNGLLHYWRATEAETIKAINECDVELARKILKRNKEMLLRIIQVKQPGDEKAEWIFNIIMNGMESIINDPTNIERNWSLGPKQRWATHCEGTGRNLHRAFELSADGITKV
jgi:hypothetical protein